MKYKKIFCDSVDTEIPKKIILKLKRRTKRRIKIRNFERRTDMVISVDTGNKMIKTEHYEFNSGIDVLDTIPGENDEVIEFGGKYYRTTNRRISYMEDKTEDDRYYILTLIAIAKELDTMKKEAVLAPNELIEIELLVGLPPAHYGKYRKKFQQYFQRDGKVVGFKYGGTSYQILIHEVKVYVQAYAAYCVLAARRHLTELPKVLVIDIGGFTVDYMSSDTEDWRRNTLILWKVA